MPTFSTRSRRSLASAHPLLQKVMWEAIKDFDFVVTESRRNRQDQEKAFAGGFSKAHFGGSAHNYTPALALDIYPYPIIWDRRDYLDGSAFRAQAAVILAASKRLGIALRWGGDWDMDGNSRDQKFNDLPHFELHPWRDYAKKAKLYKG